MPCAKAGVSRAAGGIVPRMPSDFPPLNLPSSRPPSPAGQWRAAVPVAFEGAAFAAPIAVGATALLYAKVGPEWMGPGIAAALLGMALMQLLTAGTGRPMVYATRVMEASMMLGFLDQFILKMPGWGLADTPLHRLMLVVLVSVGCALLQPLFHALRLQRFARMIPTPVFHGFSTALAVTVLISQVGVLGGSVRTDGPWFLGVALCGLLIAVLVQRIAPRWPAGVLGVVTASVAALLLAAAGLHQLADASYGQPGLLLPVQLVPWHALWAPGVATLAVLNDVFLASTTLAVLVFLNTVVNEEAVSQLDAARARPGDWWRANLGGVIATMAGASVLTPSMAPTRAAVRVGRLEWRAMLLIAALVLLTLGSGLLRWMPPAAICGLLLFDAWTSFHRPSLGMAWQWLGRRRLTGSEKEDLGTIALVVAASVVFNMVVGVFVGVFAGLMLYAWRNGRRLARTVADGTQVHSNCMRSRADTARLAEQARRLRFIELEGGLFFGAAETLFSLLRRQCAPGHYLVVDWSRVASVDSTVAQAFARAVAEAHASGTHLAMSGLDASGRQVMDTLRATGIQVQTFPDADRALEWAETELVHGATRAHEGDATTLQEALSLLRGLSPELRDTVEPLFEQRFFRASETVFEAGSGDNALMLILQGSVDILVPYGDARDTRLARLRRGAMLGELSFLDASPRAAKAVAAEDLVLGVLSRDSFDRLAREWPAAAQQLLMNLALDLSFRLRRTNRMVVERLH